MKTLVAYYTMGGNTEIAAKKIAEELNADLLHIKSVKNFKKKTLLNVFIGGMQATFKYCPKLQPINMNLDSYDRIILGTPIWASMYVPAIRSFLKKYAVNDKITYVFTCSGGGDNDKCIEGLKSLLPNLKENVALADKANKKEAPKNDEKLTRFIERIKNGN